MQTSTPLLSIYGKTLTAVLDAHRVAQSIADTIPASIEEAGAALLEVDGQHVGEILSVPEFKLSRQEMVWGAILPR